MMADDPANEPAIGPSRPGSSGLVEILQHFSHDIRAAISDVVGGVRLVDTARLDPETRLQIDRVRAAADTMAALVDAALMTAAGETLVHRAEGAVDLQSWLSNLRDRWTGRAQELGGQFLIRAEGPLPRRLLVPLVTLDRVMGNLVGNALIHAPGCKVTATFDLPPTGGLSICVRDEGTGFSADLLARFADGTSQGAGGGQGAGRGGGSGLGLRIAEELCAGLGGRLTLKNDPATGGAVICMLLPPRCLDWSPDRAEAAPMEPDLSGLNILVAEDNLTNQTILGQMLARMKADVVFVADGEAAIAALEEGGFDIGLIDIEMPRLSGIEVMQYVRARGGRLATLPLVALTAYVLRDNREAIYAAGADAIIGKPVASAAEFGRAILRYAGRPTGLPEPEDILSGADGLGKLRIKMDGARLAALLEVAGSDGAGELLAHVVEDLARILIELDLGVADSSLERIREQTHILIAISGSVGADRLCQLAEVLNIAAKRRRITDFQALYAPVRADLLDLLALMNAKRQGGA